MLFRSLEFLPTYSTSASARRAGGKSCRNAFAPGWRARRARVPPASLASPYTRPDPGDGPDMRERNFVVAAAVARWTVVLLLAIGLVACERSPRSEEHTSELQSLMRISYAVFC